MNFPNTKRETNRGTCEVKGHTSPPIINRLLPANINSRDPHTILLLPNPAILTWFLILVFPWDDDQFVVWSYRGFGVSDYLDARQTAEMLAV